MAINHKLDINEINFIKYIKQIKSEIFFIDVGCNRGLYIDEFYRGKNNITAHCFEPIKSLYDDLVDKYEEYQQLKLNNFAISDTNDEIDFFELVDPITDGCSSIIKRNIFDELKWEYKQYKVKTQTLDDYCLKEKINHIDFLKIDVEGAEYKVLKGANKLLKEKKISYIQIEYGNTTKDANINLIDIISYINSYGYELYYYNNNEFNHINNINYIKYENIDNINFIIKYG